MKSEEKHEMPSRIKMVKALIDFEMEQKDFLDNLDSPEDIL